MNTTRLSLLTIAAALALSGCGNKGPLVLPDAPDEAAAPVAAEDGTEPATDANAPAEDAEPATEPADEDAPVEPEPLPQDDGDSN
ncbi:MAG: lipoprotein [Luteimonas sp.]|nr:lipoprotein [Luteimonas sp.]